MNKRYIAFIEVEITSAEDDDEAIQFAQKIVIDSSIKYPGCKFTLDHIEVDIDTVQ